MRGPLTVLDLLLVTWGLLEGLDDQRGGRWQDLDLGLTVLNGQLDGDSQALPLGGVLGDIFRNLPWRLFGSKRDDHVLAQCSDLSFQTGNLPNPMDQSLGPERQWRHLHHQLLSG